MSDINNNLNLPWKWDEISCNQNLTIDFLLNHLDKLDNPYNIHNECVWKTISMNPGINYEDYLNNKSLPWDIKCISKNPNITMDIILNSNIIWDIRYLCYNPNITLNFLCNNIQNFSASYIYIFDINLCNYSHYFQTSNYKKKMTHLFHEQIFEELIEISMHPDRLYCSGLINELENKWIK